MHSISWVLNGTNRIFDFGFWLVHTNASGHEEWNTTFNYPGMDVMNDMIQTTDGGYLLAGFSEAVNGS